MRKIKTLFSLLTVVFLLLFAINVKAETNGEMEIIIDCSGSMAGMIGSQSKMDIAKSSIKQMIQEIPEGSNVGLRAYGHQSDRNLKNCQDTELIYPIDTINKSAFLSKVDSLNPNGWTPIDYSLRQSKNDFSSGESPKMIILVSDGEETCDGDPCQAVKDLQSAGFDVTINTIGFDVGDVAQQQLQCIADATGGEYRSAKDANELTDNLKIFSQRAFKEWVPSSACPEPGSSFVTATTIEKDAECSGRIIAGEKLFYKLDLKEGEKIKAGYYIKSESANCALKADIIIYDSVKSKKGYSKGAGLIQKSAEETSKSIETEIDSSESYYLELSYESFVSCEDETLRENVADYELTLNVSGEPVEEKPKPTPLATPDIGTSSGLGSDSSVMSSEMEKKIMEDMLIEAEKKNKNWIWILVLLVLGGFFFLIFIIIIIVFLIKNTSNKGNGKNINSGNGQGGSPRV